LFAKQTHHTFRKGRNSRSRFLLPHFSQSPPTQFVCLFGHRPMMPFGTRGTQDAVPQHSLSFGKPWQSSASSSNRCIIIVRLTLWFRWTCCLQLAVGILRPSGGYPLLQSNNCEDGCHRRNAGHGCQTQHGLCGRYVACPVE
jgi:hypothetical protein